MRLVCGARLPLARAIALRGSARHQLKLASHAPSALLPSALRFAKNLGGFKRERERERERGGEREREEREERAKSAFECVCVCVCLRVRENSCFL